MTKILKWLSGKKTTIGIIIMAILAFLQGREVISADVMTLLSVVMTALGLGANIATNKIYAKNK